MKDRLLPFLLCRKIRINQVLPYAFLFLFAVSSVALVAGLVQPQVANAVNTDGRKLIYYQGKISKTSDGTNIANGNYSMQFKIYSASSGGSLLWTETWDGGTSQVTFTNGLFSVALGTYTSLGTLDYSTGSLYLTANFNPGAGYDGEMAPRQQLTATPFAISANGVSGDGLINTTVASATALTVANTGSNYGFQVDTSTASSATGLKVTTAAAAGGLALNVISSGTNENLTFDAKGSGTISIGGVSTGNVRFGNAAQLTISNAGVLSTSGSISTTGSGAITSASTLTASSGLVQTTGAHTIVGTSGSIALTGFGATSITSTNTSGTLFSLADSTALSAAVVGQSITLSGTGAFDQTGLQFNLSNASGTNLNDIVGTGSTWKISRGGALTVASCTGCGGGGTLWNTIGDAGADGAVAMGTTAQTLDWGAITTTNALTITNSGAGLTSGSAFKVTSATAGAVTNGIVQLLASANFSGAGGLLNVTANATTAGTVAKISGTGLTTGTGLSIIGGTAMTTGSALDLNTITFVHGTETGNAAKITFTDATIAAVTSTTNGLLVTPTVSVSTGASGTKTINGISVNPSFNTCTGGSTCAVNGVNVANVTDGTGFTGTGLNIGTGWDAGFSILSGGNLIKTSSVNAFQIQNSSTTIPVFNINTSDLNTNNLIFNASFEQNIHNWAAKGTPTAGPVWDNTAGNAQFGSGALKFAGDAAGDGAQFSYPFAASTAYGVTFWAKTASGTATLRLDRQDSGSDVGGCSDSAVTTTWTQFTCTFTTGGTINTSTSNIFIKQNAAGTPTVYIDGFTMIPGSTFLNYSSPGGNLQIDSEFNNITLNANQDPDIQPWQLNSNGLPTGRRGATSITANGFAYFIGGTTANGASGAPVTTVNYAQVKADGSIGTGAWSAAANTLPVAVYGHTSIVANGYLYVIGGCSDSSVTAACTTPVSTIYYSKLNSDGSVGTWQSNASALPAARGFGAAVFANGFVYYLGGYNASAQTAVYSGRLNADGAVTGWTTTSVTALSSGRYGHTTMNVNGKIYSIGGCSDAGATCGTAITTVEYATPANDGTLGTWTAATSLPTATGFHSTSILNGHLFNVGGRQANAPVASVVYSKINSVGPLGIWATSSYALPAVRQQSTSLFVNSYIYNMGGFDGTTTLPTSAHFASGPRVSIFGGLDLISLSAQTLTDYAGAGTLTAGNTRIVGDLRIDGFADLNNGLSVDSAINLNAVSAIAGQNIFNINNLNSNSIFSVKHMSTNFGAFVSAGALVSKNSYWGEEFNKFRPNACSRTATTNTALARGDDGDSSIACATGGGPISFSSVFANTTAALPTSAATYVAGAYGVERITATGNTGTSQTVASLEYLSQAAGTLNGQFTANNLPIFTAKVKPSLTASGSNARFWIGLGDKAVASGAFPANGVFFSNCTATGTPACAGTQWIGVVTTTAGGVVGTVTCTAGTETGTINTSNFNYLRIEVRANNDIHFFVDTNTATGISEVECGSGITGTGPAATGLGPMMEAAFMTNTATTENLDIDYVRIWQDDPPDNGEPTVTTEPPLSLDSTPQEQTQFDAASLLAQFMSKTDEEESIAQTQRVDTGILTASSQIVSPTITANGLHIDSISATGDTIRFMSDTSFIGRPYFNSDTIGIAKIAAGDTYVDMTFDEEYLEQPTITVSITQEEGENANEAARVLSDEETQTLFGQNLQFLVTRKSGAGFRIVINKALSQDITFSWIALAAKNPKIVWSAHGEESAPQDNGAVAGDNTTESTPIDDSPNNIAPPEEKQDTTPTDSQDAPADTPPDPEL